MNNKQQIPQPIAPQSASTKIKQFMHGRYFEFWTCLIASLLILVLAQRLTFDMDEYSDEVGHAMFGTMIILALATAVIVRYAFRKSSSQQSKETKKKNVKQEQANSRGYRFIWYMPLVAILILSPWIAAGVFSSEGTIFGAIVLFLLLFSASLLLGILVLVFIFVPIEVLLRGILKLLRGQKEGLALVVAGVYIGMFALFIYLGSSAIETEYSTFAAWPAIAKAIIGVPGAYEVTSEPFLWATRILLIVFIFITTAMVISGKKSK